MGTCIYFHQFEAWKATQKQLLCSIPVATLTPSYLEKRENVLGLKMCASSALALKKKLKQRHK